MYTGLCCVLVCTDCQWWSISVHRGLVVVEDSSTQWVSIEVWSEVGGVNVSWSYTVANITSADHSEVIILQHRVMSGVKCSCVEGSQWMKYDLVQVWL